MKIAKPVDMRIFNRSILELSRFAGVEEGRAVEYEAGKVLEAAIRHTPAAQVQKIRERSESREWTTIDDKKYKLSNHYPDSLWGRIVQKRKENLGVKLRARGLSKQAFLRLAQAIGLKIKSAAFVNKAIPTTGKTYPQNTVARRFKSGNRLGIFFSTSQPTLQSEYVKGRNAVTRALQGRKKFFERNLKLGVFHDLKKIARAYPGLRIK